MKLKRLDADSLRPDFSCGDSDLDEFYALDSRDNGRQLLSVTYLLTEEDDTPIAFFSVSNDAIKKEQVPTNSAYRRIVSVLPHRKRYRSIPAVKIGRLGVSAALRGGGKGTFVLDFIKGWFTKGNKTGCRFIVVDAYNTPEVTHFYEKNGFKFLISTDESDSTRIMYFDLMLFRD